MDPDVVWAKTTDDKEDVAQALSKYDFLAMPIVDLEKRLVGIVTVDDAMDVIEEETTEDFEKMAAMLPSDDTYLKTSVLTLAKNRLPWLLILMISALFTGKKRGMNSTRRVSCGKNRKFPVTGFYRII